MRTTPVVLLLGVALLTGACDEVNQVVSETTEQVEDVVDTAQYCAHALAVADAVANRDVDAAVTAGRQLVEVAPDEIADAARTLLEAAEQAQAGNMAALGSDDVRAAADQLRTYTQQTCTPG